MDKNIRLNIAGLGIIIYSPFAIKHIGRGEDYLRTHFNAPEDVARHVNSCRIAAIGTGSPGTYGIRIIVGSHPTDEVSKSAAVIRLGIQVEDGKLCIRDLYNLLNWSPECPAEQTAEMDSGFYRITAFSSLPKSGILGDNQSIGLHFERTDSLPNLGWQGVPDISHWLSD